ncbi:GMC oxidoreductase [Candidatus Pelagibacter sp.]|nr:GMC oxidoreductase [Candidatus Pelagibacter sp.]
MFLKNFENYKIPKFIIVGSGPASISLALRLSSYGQRSLIIEAGDSDFSELSQSFYEGQTTGHKYYNLSDTRLRQFGGSSNHWGGSSWHLKSYDLRNWPININELNRYNVDSENILNLKLPKIKFFSKNFNKIPNEEKMTSNVNFKEKYHEEIKNSKFIDIIFNTALIKINNLKNKVNSITVLSNGKKKNLDINYLILATGGIENSRILLWSRELSNNSFLKNLPIGNYWMDHPITRPGYFIPSDKYITTYKDLTLRVEPNIDMLKKNNLNNLAFEFNITENKDINFKELIRNLLCVAPNIGQKFMDYFKDYGTLNCVGVITVSSELEPIFENKITLSKKHFDKNGVPQCILNWNLDNSWRNSIYKNLKILAEDFIKNDYGRIGIDKLIYDDNVKIPTNRFFIRGLHHHMGGTRMGFDSTKSVCDNNLKVHNVENLYLAGSSVFPSSGWAYPTINIVKLSLKLGDHLNKL